ncbi:putative helicase [Streptococcus pneumoniae]|nr:putative helicase [Streptococcus pneumoniae]
MASLYELTGQFLTIYQLDIDDETKADTLEAIDWQEQFEQKAEGYAHVIKNLEADVAMYKAEEESFKAKKQVAQKKLDYVKDNIMAAMNVTGQTEVKSGALIIKIAKNPESVKVNEDDLPKKYFTKKVTLAPDKKTLKELLKSGKKVKSFGRKTFERYLNQTGVAVDFPKLKPVNADTPLMLQLDGLIERAPHDMLIVSKSKQIVNVISERHPEIGIWTGDIQEGLYKKFVVATSQVLGVGVDGLQHKYQTIVVLDPVEEGSGEYDDYRQLLWRITGSRQQHDVNVIEFYYKES